MKIDITQKDVDESLKDEIDIGIFKNSDRIIHGVDHLVDIKPFPIKSVDTVNPEANIDYEDLFKDQIESDEMRKWMDVQKKYVLSFILNDKTNNQSQQIDRFKKIYDNVTTLNMVFNGDFQVTDYPRYIDDYNSDIQQKFLKTKFGYAPLDISTFMEFQKFIMDSPPTTEDMYVYRWISKINSDVCSKPTRPNFLHRLLQFGQIHNFLSTTWSPYFGASGQQSGFITPDKTTLLRIFIPKGSHVLLLPTKEESKYTNLYNDVESWVNFNELEIMLPMFSYLYKKPCTDIPTENTIVYRGPVYNHNDWTMEIKTLNVKMIDCCFSNTLTPEYELRIIESYILDPTIENFFNLPYDAQNKILSSIPKDHKLYKRVHQQFKKYQKKLKDNKFLKIYYNSKEK